MHTGRFERILRVLSGKGNTVDIAAIGAKVNFVVPDDVAVDSRVNIPSYRVSIVHIDTAEI